MKWLLGILTTLSLGALAQTPGYYTADRLASHPGLILVSPGYTTLVELFAPPEEQFSGNGNLIDIKTSGNLVVLFAKAKSGETDLILRAKGYTMLFRVKVVEQGEPRLYVVREPGTGTSPSGEGFGFSPTATRLQKGGVQITAQARRVESGVEVAMEVRSANLGATNLNIPGMEVRGTKGPASFTVARQGKDTLGPLEATLLRVRVPGEERITLTLPLSAGGKHLTVRLSAQPKGGDWDRVSLDIQE